MIERVFAAIGVFFIAFWLMMLVPFLRPIPLGVIDIYFGIFDVRSPF